MATGTGLVAAELLRHGFDVTGLDQSTDMLAVARQRFGGRVELVEASADAMPFPDDAFDHLTVTYLLRYVDDPAETVKELARVVRPGGVIASLEFGCPGRPAAAALAAVRRGRAPPRGPRAAEGLARGRRLPRRVDRGFWETRNPLERQLEWWRAAGIRGVEVRRLSLGSGVVMWGTKA